MDYLVVGNALSIVAQLSALVVGVTLFAALIMGVLRAATAIDDDVISFAGKLAALGCLLYLASSHMWGLISHFAERVWGGSDFYL